MSLETTLRIHRPGHLLADKRGCVEIWVRGTVGRTEKSSRYCPGDRGEVKLEPGPYDTVEGGTYHTVLSLAEDREAEEAIRSRARDVGEWGQG